MKRFISLTLIILCGFIPVFSQSQRLVLAEEFTSSTCGPCASQNPAFDALLAANSDKIISIKYHMNWPTPGNDPMYGHNTQDNNSRKNYYIISSVPHVQLDGNWFNGMPSGVNQTSINNASAVPSPFEISINQELNAAQDTIFVTMLVKATQAVTGTLVAQMAIIEKHIHFATAPGTNGEKDFYNVMKKLLPNGYGTALPSSFLPGDYILLTGSWKLANVYSISELSVVGFVQDNATKHVLQAGKTTSLPLNPVYANDGTLMSVMNVGSTECSNSITPFVTLRNNGQEALTSADIKITVNGGAETTYQWTGNLNFLETARITLPAVSFDPVDLNYLKIFITGVNGGPDLYPANDTIGFAFRAAGAAPDKVILNMKLDQHPEQTTWDVQNSEGQVIFAGGPYTQSGLQIIDTLTFTASGCYKFTIHDQGNNGICCTSGYGYFQLTDLNSVVLADPSGTITYQGDNFGSEAGFAFLEIGAGVNEPPQVSEIQVFPNPAKNRINVSFHLNRAEEVTLNILNATGEMVSCSQYLLNPGPQVISLNEASLSPGVYFLRISDGQKVYSKMLTVTR